MQILKKMIAVSAVLCIVTVASGKGEAREIPFKGSFSGSFISTQIDTNGDGATANLGQVVLNSNLGPATSQVVAEFSFVSPALCTSGNAGFEFELVMGKGFHRFHDGDLLFFEYSSGTLCFDPLLNSSSLHITANAIGGTGKYIDATGPAEIRGTSTLLISNPAGGSFGAQSGEFTGTIIIP